MREENGIVLKDNEKITGYGIEMIDGIASPMVYVNGEKYNLDGTDDYLEEYTSIRKMLKRIDRGVIKI